MVEVNWDLIIGNSEIEECSQIVIPGQIYYMYDDPIFYPNMTWKRRPVVALSRPENMQEKKHVKALNITSCFNLPDSIPILLNGKVGFALTYNCLTFRAESFRRENIKGSVSPYVFEYIKYILGRQIYGNRDPEIDQKYKEYCKKYLDGVLSGELRLGRETDINEDLRAVFLGGLCADMYAPIVQVKKIEETKTSEISTTDELANTHLDNLNINFTPVNKDDILTNHSLTPKRVMRENAEEDKVVLEEWLSDELLNLISGPKEDKTEDVSDKVTVEYPLDDEKHVEVSFDPKPAIHDNPADSFTSIPNNIPMDVSIEYDDTKEEVKEEEKEPESILPRDMDISFLISTKKRKGNRQLKQIRELTPPEVARFLNYVISSSSYNNAAKNIREQIRVSMSTQTLISRFCEGVKSLSDEESYEYIEQKSIEFMKNASDRKGPVTITLAEA